MLKKEIYKLFINSLFQITLLFVFVVLFLITIYNSLSTEKSDVNISSQGIISVAYRNQEDISKHLEITKVELESLNADLEFYEQTKTMLEYRMKLYEYLQGNYIPYEQLVDSDILSAFPTENFYSYHTKTLAYLSLIIILIVLIMSYIVFSIDFDCQSYKYIYVKGNRTKLIINKSILIMVCTIIFSIIICAVVSFYASLLYMTEPQSIIFFRGNDLFVIGKGLFMFLDSISLLAFIIPMCLLIIGISLNFKKTIYIFLVFFVYFLCLSLVPSITTNVYALSLFKLPIFTYIDHTLWLNLSFNISISLIVYLIGLYRFKNNDL